MSDDPSTTQSSLGKLTTELIEIVSHEFQKEETKEKIKQAFLDPLLYYVLKSLQPYLIVITAILLLVVSMHIYLIYKLQN